MLMAFLLNDSAAIEDAVAGIEPEEDDEEEKAVVPGELTRDAYVAEPRPRN